MSTTPAFSPMPASSLPTGVSGGSSANWRRCTDDLYEQCRHHMTEYMASSDEVGRRPRISLIRAYASSDPALPMVVPGPSSAGVADSVCHGGNATGSDADSPIAPFCPVQEEPAHHHRDLRRCCGEPDTDLAVVEQRPESRRSGWQPACCVRCRSPVLLGARGSSRSLSRPGHRSAATRCRAGGNSLSRRDRLAADHVQRVPVQDSLHEIAQVRTPIRSAQPVGQRSPRPPAPRAPRSPAASAR